MLAIFQKSVSNIAFLAESGTGD